MSIIEGHCHRHPPPSEGAAPPRRLTARDLEAFLRDTERA